MFCRKCGKQIPDDSEFCFKCGARVEVTPERSATDAVKTFFAEKYKETETKPAVSLEKEKPKPLTKKTDRRICPSCGKEIPSPMWKLCPHCNEKLSQPDKPSNVGDEKQSRYKKALSALYCSNDINTLREARDTFISLGDYFDSNLKVQECGDKIYKIKNNIDDAIAVLRHKEDTQASIASRKCDGSGEFNNCGSTNLSYNSRYSNSSTASEVKKVQDKAKSHMADTKDNRTHPWGCIVPIALAIIFVIGGVLSPEEAACALAEGAGEGLIEGLFGLVVLGVLGLIVNLIRKNR